MLQSMVENIYNINWNVMQIQAVEDYYRRLSKAGIQTCVVNSTKRSPDLPEKAYLEEFDENSLVLITESDLDGYEENRESGQNIQSELKLACRVQFASQAAMARLSCLWLRCHTGQKVSRNEMQSSVGVDIHVY